MSLERDISEVKRDIKFEKINEELPQQAPGPTPAPEPVDYSDEYDIVMDMVNEEFGIQLSPEQFNQAVEATKKVNPHIEDDMHLFIDAHMGLMMTFDDVLHEIGLHRRGEGNVPEAKHSKVAKKLQEKKEKK